MSPFLTRGRRGQRRISRSITAVVETMEQRRLLTASMTNGILNVTGTSGNDVVYMYYTGYQTNNWAVNVNGIVDWSGPAASVKGFNVFTGAGNDNISINPIDAPPATLLGGDGNDTLQGTNDDDSLDGGAGIDSIVGNEGNDTLIGGTETDYFTGGEGNDSCDGGDGADYFWADGGSDTYIGGLGNDIMDYTAATDPLSLTLDDVANDGGPNWGYADNLTSSLETILGGTGSDTISGEGGPNYIQGGNGNDVIWGVGGNDSLSGNGGNDSVYGGSGNDSVYGQAGNDVLDGAGGNDYLEGNAGYDSITGGSGGDLLHGQDNVNGDTLDGGADQDSVYADAGDILISI